MWIQARTGKWVRIERNMVQILTATTKHQTRGQSWAAGNVYVQIIPDNQNYWSLEARAKLSKKDQGSLGRPHSGPRDPELHPLN